MAYGLGETVKETGEKPFQFSSLSVFDLPGPMLGTVL